jgi:ketosteroid isomerase-like protein
MPARLPEPLAAYYAAQNTHDIDAMIAAFAEGAVVKDEGKEHHGVKAVREWMEETTRKYRVTVEVADVAEAAGNTLVTGLVSGNFKGSPVGLRYTFILDRQKISRLDIG